MTYKSHSLQKIQNFKLTNIQLLYDYKYIIYLEIFQEVIPFANFKLKYNILNEIVMKSMEL